MTAHPATGWPWPGGQVLQLAQEHHDQKGKQVQRTHEQVKESGITHVDLQRDLAPPQPLRPAHCWAEAHLTPVLATGA